MPCTFAPECFHGTHVAGIAVGYGAELDGVARDAWLMAIRVFAQVAAATAAHARSHG